MLSFCFLKSLIRHSFSRKAEKYHKFSLTPNNPLKKIAYGIILLSFSLFSLKQGFILADIDYLCSQIKKTSHYNDKK